MDEKMHKKKITLIMIVLLNTILVDGSVAQNAADRQFEFAGTLFKQERYKTSITEFQRFLFLFPNDKRIFKAYYQMGMAYQMQKQYVFAIEQYHKITPNGPEKKIRIQAVFALSECYQAKRNHLMAKSVLESLLQEIKQTKTQDKIHYRLAWLDIKTNQFDNAITHLNAINGVSIYPIEAIKETIQAKNLPRKNPYLAGILSIIPGLGQIYCERYNDAALSFIVNGIIGWAAWESFDQQKPALGTLISFFGMGFYSGNIYGAINSAHKYNRQTEKQWYDHVKSKADSINTPFWENK
jgi:tetratricopeptide (TPR) repeat protein